MQHKESSTRVDGLSAAKRSGVDGRLDEEEPCQSRTPHGVEEVNGRNDVCERARESAELAATMRE